MNKEIERYEGELRELRERVKELEVRLNIPIKYFIKENYVHREKVRYHDDTKKSYNSDMWQKEVYVLAKEYAKEREHIRILDIGTGSGFKLLKYFDDFDTIGMDLPSTVEWLKIKYKGVVGWVRYLVPDVEITKGVNGNINDYVPNKWFTKDTHNYYRKCQQKKHIDP